MYISLSLYIYIYIYIHMYIHVGACRPPGPRRWAARTAPGPSWGVVREGHWLIIDQILKFTELG